MKEKGRSTGSDSCGTDEGLVSRRMVVGSSGVAILGLLGASTFAQEEIDWERVRESQQRALEMNREAQRRGQEASLQRLRERMGPEQAELFERMRNAASMEERMQVMQGWHFQQSLANLKNQLGVSEEEWKVVQPRLETVYLLRHPPASVAPEDTSASAVVTRQTKELWEPLNNKEAEAEVIKTKLTALRNARERVRQELAKARQELRKLMTVRQEAVLVLSELLD